MNDSNRIGSLGGLKIWIILASLVIVIAGLKMAAQMVILFLLAILLTAIALAPFDWLKKKKHFNFSDFTDEAGNNMLEETLIDPEPLPSELMERADVGQILEKALKQLPLSYQTVLILHYNEHFTLSEIAEILGEPKNTVKSRHRRGLIILRKILTAEP